MAGAAPMVLVSVAELTPGAAEALLRLRNEPGPEPTPDKPIEAWARPSGLASWRYAKRTTLVPSTSCTCIENAGPGPLPKRYQFSHSKVNTRLGAVPVVR